MTQAPHHHSDPTREEYGTFDVKPGQYVAVLDEPTGEVVHARVHAVTSTTIRADAVHSYVFSRKTNTTHKRYRDARILFKVADSVFPYQADNHLPYKPRLFDVMHVGTERTYGPFTIREAVDFIEAIRAEDVKQVGGWDQVCFSDYVVLEKRGDTLTENEAIERMNEEDPA